MMTFNKFVDDLCLSGAWIKDRINGHNPYVSGKSYNKSVTKKIRKALGYTIWKIKISIPIYMMKI